MWSSWGVRSATLRRNPAIAFFLAQVVNLMAQEGTLTAPLADVHLPEGVEQRDRAAARRFLRGLEPLAALAALRLGERNRERGDREGRREAQQPAATGRIP